MTVRAVISLIGFTLVVASAIYFGLRSIENFQEIAETPAEDAYYEAHGCYVSDGGSMFTCPNGAPPDPDANPVKSTNLDELTIIKLMSISLLQQISYL